MLPFSVVIDDFDLHRALVGPDEADAPLVVNSDAVLSGAVAAERFETMRRWHSQIG